MYGGGVAISRRTEMTLRIAAFVVPFLLFGYGVLIDYGIINNGHYLNTTVLYVLMPLWILLGTYQFIFNVKNATDAAIRVGGFHLFAVIYLLCIAGTAMPFMAGWVILFLAAYAFFSDTGLRISMAILLFTVVADAAFFTTELSSLLSTIVVTAAVVIVGSTAVAIGRSLEVDSAELVKSKQGEAIQRDRILTLVNNLADAILSTDRNGVIRVYNAASLNLLDTNQGLNDQHIDDAVALYDQEGNEVSLYRVLKKTKSVTIRDDLSLRVGPDAIRLEVTVSSIRGSFNEDRSGDLDDGFIIILRDITKAKSLEEERDEFISVVSHELRTPITVTEGTISNAMIMLDRPDVPHDKLQSSMKAAHDQVVYLAKMVNDLSTLSRAERGVADAPEDIEVRALVHELFSEYAPQAEKKGLQFNLDLDPHLGHVTASRLYLKELLQNLITNAIKYTHEGKITFIVENKHGDIVFTIKDTGIGISKTDQKKIFNKFYRSEDYRTRETGGTGLGLYVAAKLSKKLATTVELTSRLNHGSAFSFKLPMQKSPNETTH